MFAWLTGSFLVSRQRGNVYRDLVRSEPREEDTLTTRPAKGENVDMFRGGLN